MFPGGWLSKPVDMNSVWTQLRSSEAHAKSLRLMFLFMFLHLFQVYDGIKQGTRSCASRGQNGGRS